MVLIVSVSEESHLTRLGLRNIKVGLKSVVSRHILKINRIFHCTAYLLKRSSTNAVDYLGGSWIINAVKPWGKADNRAYFKLLTGR
jgi:hypothetical protein